MQCLSTHGEEEEPHKYIHVYKFSEEKIAPIFEALMEKMSKPDFTLGKETEEITNTMKDIADPLKKVVNTHDQFLKEINSMIRKLDSLLGPVKHKPYSELMRAGLTADKAKLEHALENKDSETIIKLTQKIQGEAEIAKKMDLEKRIIPKIKAQVKKIEYMKVYQDLAKNLEQLAFKCHRMGLNCCVADWKLDRKYLCAKLTLTPDCLTLGNNASSGYQAVIGDTPIESGIMIYEVTPISLNCSGNEGFGAIELEKYKEIYNRNPADPRCYSEMMGIFHGNQCHNMTKSSPVQMQNNSKYIAVLDLNTLEFKIRGPGTDVSTTLKAGIAYVPCFSVGCTSNQLIVKPLSDFGEFESMKT